MSLTLKKIFDIPGGFFSDPFMERYVFPPEFPSVDMVPHVALNSSLKEFGMDEYITDTSKEPPKKPDTPENRLCLPLGSMSSREIDSYCAEVTTRVGAVVVRPFRAASGFLKQTLPQPETPVVESKQIETVAPPVEEPPTKQSPDPVNIVPADDEQEIVPVIKQVEQLSMEPVDASSAGWISTHKPDIESSDSSDDSDSIFASDEHSEDVSEQPEKDQSESSVYEDAPKLDQMDEDSDADSDDIPRQILHEVAVPPKKRKIPERKARNHSVKPFEVKHNEDLVENDNGDLVPAKQGKPKAKQKAKGPGAKQPTPTKKKSAKPPAKRQMTYESVPFNPERLFDAVNLERYNHRESTLYKRLRELWLNMLWFAAYECHGDPRVKDLSQRPFTPTITGIILQTVRNSLTPESSKYLRTIYACSEMKVVVLSDHRYRIRFSAPMPHTVELYPFESTSVICRGLMECTAYVRAHYALRPSKYLLCIARKICTETKNLPETTGSAQKLYEHNKANRKQMDSVFIDWGNMALLSRFEIFE